MRDIVFGKGSELLCNVDAIVVCPLLEGHIKVRLNLVRWLIHIH